MSYLLIGSLISVIAIISVCIAQDKIETARRSGYDAGWNNAFKHRDDKNHTIASLQEENRELEIKLKDVWAKGYGDANSEIFIAMIENPKTYHKFIEDHKKGVL